MAEKTHTHAARGKEKKYVYERKLTLFIRLVDCAHHLNHYCCLKNWRNVSSTKNCNLFWILLGIIRHLLHSTSSCVLFNVFVSRNWEIHFKNVSRHSYSRFEIITLHSLVLYLIYSYARTLLLVHLLAFALSAFIPNYPNNGISIGDFSPFPRVCNRSFSRMSQWVPFI